MKLICFEMELWIVFVFLQLTIIKRKGTVLSMCRLLLFLLGSLQSRGWENDDPTSVLLMGMPLSPITRAKVVIFSELGFAVSVLSTSF